MQELMFKMQLSVWQGNCYNSSMKAKAWRLYGAKDARLEDIELEGAGEDGIVVEIVTNTICLSDYKGATLGTGHKRVPKDIATRPTMFGHEVSGIVREVGEKWKGQFRVGQRVGLQPSLNIPGHELETVGYACAHHRLNYDVF